MKKLLRLAVVIMLLPCMNTRPLFFGGAAYAAPPWAASGTQVCAETFAGTDLNSSWTPVPAPTVATLINNGILEAELPSNYIMTNPGVSIVPRHQNFPATPTYVFNYTSAYIQSRGGTSVTGGSCGNNTYGYYEAVMKLPPITGGAQGLWPAFWLMPSASGSQTEIDVMERFTQNYGQWTDPTHAVATFHWNNYGNGATLCAAVDAAGWAGQHTFAVDWEPGTITTYYDGAICTSTQNPTGTFINGGVYIPSLGSPYSTQVTATGSGGTAGTYAFGKSGGSGCAGTLAGTYTISGGQVTNVAITNPDSGCTSAPTITFPSGGVSGASVTVGLMGGVPSTPDYMMFDNYVANNINLAQEQLIDQGLGQTQILQANVWIKNSVLPQTPMALHISNVTLDKAVYSPGDTLTATATLTAGNSAVTNASWQFNVYDFNGDNTGGYSPLQAPPTNNTFGSQANSAGVNIAAHGSAVVPITWTVPSSIPTGVYTGETSVSDNASDGDSSNFRIIVGNALP